MEPPSKDSIIQAYNDLVKQSDGRRLGEGVFKRETGISPHYWRGGYWRSWSAFQTDAGHEPNIATQRIPDESLLRRFAELVVELNAIPTQADLRLKRKEDASFPDYAAYRRWGGKDAMLEKLRGFCAAKPEYTAASALLVSQGSVALDRRLDSNSIKGFVYLLRSGKNYKLGRTNAAGRRLRELAIQLPQKSDTIHVIETDDPEGIEQYWHRRFEDRRQGGEWFALTAEDVKAFKRRRFQ